MSKRFYWLKLHENFFDREEIKVIEDMKGGKDYIIFYMKLLLRSVGTNGKLMFRDIIPYTPEMLASITNTDKDTVVVATNMFVELGMMEKLDDGSLFMNEVQNMVGSETASAKRVRAHRERKALAASKATKALQCNDQVTKSNTEIDTDKEDIYAQSFAQFYQKYPKKRNKQTALRSWMKLKPDADLLEKIMSSLEKHKLQPDWQKDNGQFVPYPSTWLNQRRWEDELEPARSETIYRD